MKFVPDLLNHQSTLRLIFVLESPYKDEIIHGHPLAGKSGITVSKYINSKIRTELRIDNYESTPFGCFINKHNIGIGVMNASQIPLDKRCYSCYFSDFKFIKALDLIRRNPTSLTRIDSYDNKTEQNLIDNFKNRVNAITNQSVSFLPCGDLAEKFLNQTSLPSNRKLNKIIHPSANAWDGEIFEELDHILATL